MTNGSRGDRSSFQRLTRTIREDLEKRFQARLPDTFEDLLWMAAYRFREGAEALATVFYLEFIDALRKDELGATSDSSSRAPSGEYTIADRDLRRIIGRVVRRASRAEARRGTGLSHEPSDTPQEELWELVDGLTQDMAMLVGLRLAGSTVVEIAENLGVSQATVSRRLRSAGARLTSLGSEASQDLKHQLRAAKKRAQVKLEKGQRIADAINALNGCAGYATPGMPIHIFPGESRALQEERAGAAETLDANMEFCEAWVQNYWIPSIDAVLRVVGPEVIERFEPHVPEKNAGAEVLRISFRATHHLYCRLLRDRGAASEVIQDLAELRKELGRNRYVIQQVFSQLAGHVGRTTRPPPPSMAAELPVLSEDAAIFRDILLKRRPEDALTGPRLCELFGATTGKGVDDAEFRTSVVPLLKAWGLKNRPKIGYYFPADAPARRRG